MNIGQGIKKARKSKKVKQYILAKDSGITQSYLSTIEGGIKKPSLDVLENISKALGTPLPFIVWFSMELNDVPNEKLEAYNTISPIINNLIESLIKD